MFTTKVTVWATRVRRAEFPIAAFRGTDDKRIEQDLMERMRGNRLGSPWCFWYDRCAAVVRVQVYSNSFDLIQPGEEIPIDHDIRLLPVDHPDLRAEGKYLEAGEAIRLDNCTVAPNQDSPSAKQLIADLYREFCLPFQLANSPGETEGDRLARELGQTDKITPVEPDPEPKAETWRDRMIKDPLW